MFNKLGTVLNTLGSLGTGWFGSKLVTIDLTTVDINQLLNWDVGYPLIISISVLFLGLLLRIRDIIDKNQKLEAENRIVKRFQDTNKLLTNRLDDLNQILEATIETVIKKKLPTLIKLELQKELRDKSEGVRTGYSTREVDSSDVHGYTNKMKENQNNGVK